MSSRSNLSGFRRRGFTLPEILVSISLVAVLAAVVVPAIASQARKGDPTRVGNDMMGVRGGVEQFLSDVRRYPAGVTQLITPIGLTGAPLAGTVTSGYLYGQAEVNRWRGPYLSKDAAAALQTGFGWNFKQAFDFDGYAASGTVGSSGVSSKYMILAIGITDPSGAQQLDALFDDGDLTAGSIRYRVCTATPTCSPALDTVKFFLMPIY